MFMEQRVNCSPEQLGIAQEQWTRLLETRFSNMPHSPSAQNCQTPEFISLDNNNQNQGFVGENEPDPSKRRRENRASTYGISQYHRRHYRQPPWKPKGRRYTKGALGFHEEIQDFFNYMSPEPEEEAMRNDVVRRIENVIHDTWPSARVEIFGSFRTGLYLPTSDIDMVIFGNWSDPPLSTMERKLVESGICYPNEIKVLHNASVPIVKLVDSKTDIKVDISYNMESGIKSAHFITELMETYPYLRHLVLVLKQFLLQRDLNEVFTGGISSYSLILMVVSFLQMRSPRADVTMEQAAAAYHNQYNSHAANNSARKQYNACDKMNQYFPNLGILLIEFFELYGINFNYLHIGLRIRDGGAYVKKEHLMQDMDNGYKQSLLCIEDPLNPSNDVGRSSYCAMHVKAAFKHAFHTLCPRLMHQHYYLCDEDESILSRIVHVTQEVQEYRKWVRDTFPLPSPPSSPLPASPSYSYACAVKTGANPKDLNSVGMASVGSTATAGAVGKSDGEESDCSSSSSIMCQSTSPSLSAASSTISTSPPASISSGDSEEEEQHQGPSSASLQSRISCSTAAPHTAPPPPPPHSHSVAQQTNPPSSSSSSPSSHYRDALRKNSSAAASKAAATSTQSHHRCASASPAANGSSPQQYPKSHHSSRYPRNQSHHHHHHHHQQHQQPRRKRYQKRPATSTAAAASASANPTTNSSYTSPSAAAAANGAR